VLLSNYHPKVHPKTYTAEIKEYSPPINKYVGKLSYTFEGYERENESGKDIAILKIQERHLPTAKNR
jgi:hypothetical protein